MKRKFLIICSLMAVFFTQTGFIAGIVTVNPVLIAVGAVGTACCGGMSCCFGKASQVHDHSSNLFGDTDAQCSCVTGFWACLCISLGKDKSTSSPISLGPFPEKGKSAKKFAQSLEVEIKDIQVYNKDLEETTQLYQWISAFLGNKMKSYSWDGKIESLPSIEEHLLKDPELESFAKDVGFKGTAELVQTFKTDEVSVDTLERFAAAIRMTPQTAKIFLQKAFLVKTVNPKPPLVMTTPQH